MSLEDKTTVKAIKSALTNFKKQMTGTSDNEKLNILADAYHDAMDRVRGQKPGLRELADKVLTWIVFATRPLKTTELQHALAVEVGETELAGFVGKLFAEERTKMSAKVGRNKPISPRMISNPLTVWMAMRSKRTGPGSRTMANAA